MGHGGPRRDGDAGRGGGPVRAPRSGRRPADPVRGRHAAGLRGGRRTRPQAVPRGRRPGRQDRGPRPVVPTGPTPRTDTASSRLRAVRERLAVRSDVPSARREPRPCLGPCPAGPPGAPRRGDRRGAGRPARPRPGAPRRHPRPGELGHVPGRAAGADRGAAARSRSAGGLARPDTRLPRHDPAPPRPGALPAAHRGHAAALPDRPGHLAADRPLRLRARDDRRPRLRLRRRRPVRHPGDPDLLARLSRAYGHTFAPDQLLAYTLLHVYSNLPWYMRELHVPVEGTLESLAEAWFGTE